MATIIRKDNPREMHSGREVQPVAFSFADMRGQANDYLGTVRAEAAKIVAQAHQQAEQIRRQAEVAGRQAAEAAIERVLDERVGKRMETLIPALENLLGELNDTKAQLLSRWEKSTLKVASAIAERIIHRELSQEPQITLNLVADTLHLAAGMAELRVHISPTDHENMGTQIVRLAETIGNLAPTAIIADPSITPGGCRVTTKFGEIDQQIESQLRRIEEELA
ncbi:MAG TPA: FliH/SctL family protein [Lacipirellulaceae bacterium]|nr:FliH/SctL family protein [Lacipirellulaceae bacterium]